MNLAPPGFQISVVQTRSDANDFLDSRKPKPIKASIIENRATDNCKFCSKSFVVSSGRPGLE